MRQAGDAELPALLLELKLHLHSHFALENNLMQSSGFPASECHISEHAAVLQSIEDVIACVQQGRLDDCRRLVVALADWFPGHSDYLDSALAQWIVSRSTGGKPVVIRRNQSL
jgi:hemerythrin-like metal-binding protein